MLEFSLESLAPWQWWVAVSAMLLVVEMISVSFFALFFALGAVAAAIYAYVAGHHMAWELGIFIVASLASLWVFRPLCQQWFNMGRQYYQPSNIDALIGKEAVALTDITADGGRVQLRHTGEHWTAYTNGAPCPAQSVVIVNEVNGAKLVVQVKN